MRLMKFNLVKDNKPIFANPEHISMVYPHRRTENTTVIVFHMYMLKVKKLFM